MISLKRGLILFLIFSTVFGLVFWVGTKLSNTSKIAVVTDEEIKNTIGDAFIDPAKLAGGTIELRGKIIKNEASDATYQYKLMSETNEVLALMETRGELLSFASGSGMVTITGTTRGKNANGVQLVYVEAVSFR